MVTVFRPREDAEVDASTSQSVDAVTTTAAVRSISDKFTHLRVRR